MDFTYLARYNEPFVRHNLGFYGSDWHSWRSRSQFKKY